MIYTDYIKHTSVTLNKILFKNNDLSYKEHIFKLLTALLGKDYGIIIGQAQADDGALSHEAILIYDAKAWPLSKLLHSHNTASSIIPLSSVYAYLEVHDTLYLEDTTSDASIDKALIRAAAYKRLLREKMPITNNNSHSTHAPTKGLSLANPLYVMIMTRNIQLNVNKATLNSRQIHPIFNVFCKQLPVGDAFLPDTMVCGEDLAAIPWVSGQYTSPFLVPGQSQLHPVLAPGNCISLALNILLHGLSVIQLPLPAYAHIIAQCQSPK